MIDIKFIRENIGKVKKGVLAKGVKVDIDKLLKVDNKRRSLIKEVEGLKAEKNKLGKEFRSEAKKIKDKIKKLEPQLVEIEKEFNDLMVQIPNPAFDDIPVGKDESLAELVAKIVDIIDVSGLPYKLTAMGTLVEGEWDDIHELIKECHFMMKRYSSRVMTFILSLIHI